MLRAFAILTFVAALILGQSGRGPAEAATVQGDGLVMSALVHVSEHGTARHWKERCPPSQAGCHSSSSPTLALLRGDASHQSKDRSTIGLKLSDRRLRAILLKRDPPVPRSLI